MSEAAPRRCGYVALVGAPNAGKSTLLNQLVGAKLSIVSPKVQTTRSRVLGIVVEDAAQLVFVDTPGIFAPKRRLERAMVAAAWAGAEDADFVVVLVDAARGVDADAERIIAGLKSAGRRAVLVLNKVDLVDPPRLLPLADRLRKEALFDAVFMVSALTGDGVADLRRHLAAALPEGPWLYPEDQLTDLPMRLLAAEVTREQVFLQLQQELPYATLVETETWEERADGSIKIGQAIHVQRASQKAIMLGKGGSRVKEIGARARAELEHTLGRRVHLFLFVRVTEDWTEDRERYRAMGLEFES
ncbi:MAG TPA: GTPase Era [Stellaceae bacterium]|nr:GTPase Era [Stellaceae bacterium]